MTAKQLGKKLREARGKRALRELSRTTGLHRGVIRSIEEASANYTQESLFLLATAVGVDIRGVKIEQP